MPIPRLVSRRWFLEQCGVGLGAMALGSCSSEAGYAARYLAGDAAGVNPLAPRLPHFAPKAKRVIFLFMAGGPSHLELFDNKPQLAKFDGTLPPAELLKGYRAAFINPTRSCWARSSSSPGTASAGPSSRSCCRTWRRSSTTSPSSRGCPPTRSTMPRARS